MKYSKEFRDKVCQEYLTTDIGRKEICEKYNIKLNTLKSWFKRYYSDMCISLEGQNKYKGNKSLVENNDYKDMTNEQLQIELIKKDFEIERLKKNYQVMINPITGKKRIHFFKRLEYQIVFMLSDKYSVLSICNTIGINRSGYYRWRDRQTNYKLTQNQSRESHQNRFI